LQREDRKVERNRRLEDTDKNSVGIKNETHGIGNVRNKRKE